MRTLKQKQCDAHEEEEKPVPDGVEKREDARKGYTTFTRKRSLF